MLRHPERKCVITNAKQAALDKPSNSLPVNAEEFKGGKNSGQEKTELSLGNPFFLRGLRTKDYRTMLPPSHTYPKVVPEH